MAFEYDEDGKRLENVNGTMLLEIATEVARRQGRSSDIRYIARLKNDMRCSIMEQVAEITAATHHLGYVGNNEDGFDHNTGNFRLIVREDGTVKIKLVGDFEAFNKPNDAMDAEKRRGEDIWQILKYVGGGSVATGLCVLL